MKKKFEALKETMHNKLDQATIVFDVYVALFVY